MPISEENQAAALVYILNKAQENLDSAHSKTTHLLLFFARQENGIDKMNQFLTRLADDDLTPRDKELITVFFLPQAINRRDVMLKGACIAAMAGIGAMYKGNVDKKDNYKAAGLGLMFTAAALAGLDQKLQCYRKQVITDSPEFKATVEDLVQNLTPVLTTLAQSNEQQPGRG